MTDIDLRVWMQGVIKAWQEHWEGRDHRYGQDFAAFVGERLMTDFELRDLERRRQAVGVLDEAVKR
jgi:hypothetical protein